MFDIIIEMLSSDVLIDNTLLYKADTFINACDTFVCNAIVVPYWSCDNNFASVAYIIDCVDVTDNVFNVVVHVCGLFNIILHPFIWWGLLIIL